MRPRFLSAGLMTIEGLFLSCCRNSFCLGEMFSDRRGSGPSSMLLRSVLVCVSQVSIEGEAGGGCQGLALGM